MALDQFTNLDLDIPMINERVLGNLSTAILLVDDKLEIIFSNQAAESLLHESAGQMKGRPLTAIIANGGEVAALVTKAVESNQLFTRRQMPLELPGRDSVKADITITPLPDVQQALVELIPMDRYLRIEGDAAIKEHYEITRQMVKGLAHEIKNPLGGIKGSAQLLSRELPNESLTEYTSIIIEEADRLTSLVDRMLGPNSLPDLLRTNFHEVLERTAKLIELESPNLTIVRDYDPSIPDLSIDPELMQQAMLNVVRNAMQCLEATPLPAITLTTRIERQFTIAGKRHKMVLQVGIHDNGPGIPEEIQEHLFYPMISRRPGGTGLGLTFAQNIINQHGGMVEFDSIPGSTTFKIFIPLEQSK